MTVLSWAGCVSLCTTGKRIGLTTSSIAFLVSHPLHTHIIVTIQTAATALSRQLLIVPLERTCFCSIQGAGQTGYHSYEKGISQTPRTDKDEHQNIAKPPVPCEAEGT